MDNAAATMTARHDDGRHGDGRHGDGRHGAARMASGQKLKNGRATGRGGPDQPDVRDDTPDRPAAALPASEQVLSDTSVATALTIVAFAVRLFKIYNPAAVVFDEVHFGGFASKYIQRSFFMDVHPPLAKLLIALCGYLAGYDGSFSFKEIGMDYLEPNVPYVAMRLFPACCGVLVIPIAFFTLKRLGCATSTAILGALLVLFENALLTQSRLILLDSPLVLATAITIFAWSSFSRLDAHGTPFTTDWWLWLFFSGLGLGITLSIKWVGVFTTGWIGTLTVIQLWNHLGNISISPKSFAKHFFARSFCLILVPTLFYLATFAVHLSILTQPGDGATFMSSEFQQSFEAKRQPSVPRDVAYGSTVTIRHLNSKGGYLHSHGFLYQSGSQQQQITLYPHRDNNNDWKITNMTDFDYDTMEPIYLKNGDIIRLDHLSTGKRLHSHDVRPYSSDQDWQNEATAYGYPGFEGDGNDWFKINVVNSSTKSPRAREYIHAIETKFQLVHLLTGCFLLSREGGKLPDWGFSQQEVVCAKSATPPNTIWYIETNSHPNLREDAARISYRLPSFWDKFLELQRIMWKINSGLVERHAFDSRPSAWPILKRGISFWVDNHRQIYFTGNPVVWWATSTMLVVWAFFKLVLLARWQRGYRDYQQCSLLQRYDLILTGVVLGWAFHFFPFFLMKRQLFLHHYLPSLYFAILAFCLIWDMGTSRLCGRNSRYASHLVVLLASIVIGVYHLYSPIAYGSEWTKGQCEQAKLLKSWDYNCNIYPDAISEYATLTVMRTPAPTGQPSASADGIQPGEGIVPEDMLDGVDTDALIDETNIPEQAAIDKADEAISESAQVEMTEILDRIEYRDEAGNLLDEAEFSRLRDQYGSSLELSTIYETSTEVL